MGKPSKAKEAKKNEKFLEYGTIVLNTINQKMSVHNTIYSWKVPNYRKLERYVMYFQVFESYDVKCVLKLFKARNTLYLCLQSANVANKLARFYLLNETDHTSLAVQAVEIQPGLFFGDFKLELFEDTESHYLKKGYLAVSFRYVSKQATELKESIFDGVDLIADMDELCSDLRFMYLESLYPDFEIIVADYIFKTHKFILAARTDFFHKYLISNPKASKYELETVPGILHEVLLFIYCGELNDMDMACMMEVTVLAVKLEVSSLIDKCLAYFNEVVNESNFEQFKAFQNKKQYAVLEEVVRKFERKKFDG